MPVEAYESRAPEIEWKRTPLWPMAAAFFWGSPSGITERTSLARFSKEHPSAILRVVKILEA